jgi:cell wall-associated NlpC family hydrolase
MSTGTSSARIAGADVVRRARVYLGTPFLHQGRVLGRGVDCVGLILSVAEDLQLVDRAGRPFKRSDYHNYGRQPLERFVHDECLARLEKRPLAELKDGDVVSMRVPHLPTHTAIVALRDGVEHVIHAYEGSSGVVEHILSLPWRRRIVGAFCFPGVG